LDAILPARIASDAAGVLGSPLEAIVRLRPLGSGSGPVRPGTRKVARGMGSGRGVRVDRLGRPIPTARDSAGGYDALAPSGPAGDDSRAPPAAMRLGTKE
jgi:hypothetical protein